MTGLPLDAARRILDAALREARAGDCQPLAVAVLDDGGHLKAFAREDGAGILRPEIAIGKAWGALGMGVGSRALAARAVQGAGVRAFFAAVGTLAGGKLVPAPGGVLVRDGEGGVVGAVGISGDTSDRDEACAVAGIRAAGLAADTG